MKKYLVIVILFMSSFITAQTIVTNIISSLDASVEGVVLRNDTFYVKSNLIIWSSIDGSSLYYITSYYKLQDNNFMIYCNTEGKLITFIVDFNKEYVIIDNKLLFSKFLRI